MTFTCLGGLHWWRSTAAATCVGLLPLSPLTAVDGMSADAPGFYAGGHVAVDWGASDWASAAQAGSLSFYKPYNLSDGNGSYAAGLQVGHTWRLMPRVLAGIEIDASAPNTVEGISTLRSADGSTASFAEKVDWSGTVRGRLGYDLGPAAVYATLGWAWSWDRLARTQINGAGAGGAGPGTVEANRVFRSGLAAGAGAEFPLDEHWSADLTYLFTHFDRVRSTFAQGGQQFNSDLDLHSVRVGLNYHFGDHSDQPAAEAAGGEAKAGAANWSVHGQTTYVHQYALPFNAPYQGANSLTARQSRETWDATAYIGYSPWQGAEIWFSPEIDQGFGLAGTTGAAGFTSGEAYKTGAPYPYARIPRLFLRQTIDLGGAQQLIDHDDFEITSRWFGETQAANRLVFTAGKLAVTDIFDRNEVAHEPRLDFFNWSAVNTGTFDYAADAFGFTYGGALEWVQGPWRLAGGVFDLSAVPNSLALDPAFKQVQMLLELERRYELWGQAGRIAVTGFLSRARLGRYDDAIAVAAFTGDAATTAPVRHYRSRTGISFNANQAVTPEINVFARAGISDGNIEPYDFTDIDRTVAVGMTVKGTSWGRAGDILGVAGIVNGISGQHQAFLNAGGLGILVGDGRLPHPSTEKIFETFYSFPVLKLRVTLDYQLIADPAYNQDRGPVSVIGTRLRADF